MERRIAAILAGDMVGYSRLTELDEAGTLARHRQHMAEAITPAIERLGGHIFKTTGDGMIAEFGSVIEAVKSAVSIQKGHSDPRNQPARGPPHSVSHRRQSWRRGVPGR